VSDDFPQRLTRCGDTSCMSSYYKQINNRQFDRALLEKAAELQDSPRDGRISKDDAKELAAEVNDGGVRTETEDRTVRKIYREANFTAAGRDEFARLNRSAGQERRHNAPKAEDAQKLAVTGQASQLGLRVQQNKL